MYDRSEYADADDQCRERKAHDTNFCHDDLLSFTFMSLTAADRIGPGLDMTTGARRQSNCTMVLGMALYQVRGIPCEFLDRQGRVHARTSVDFVKEFGCCLAASMRRPQGISRSG